jgi:hypothetical protein
MRLIAVTGTARTSIVVVFLYDIIASQHCKLCLLQQTPELGVARISEIDRAQLGLIAYPAQTCQPLSPAQSVLVCHTWDRNQRQSRYRQQPDPLPTHPWSSC